MILFTILAFKKAGHSVDRSQKAMELPRPLSPGRRKSGSCSSLSGLKCRNMFLSRFTGSIVLWRQSTPDITSAGYARRQLRTLHEEFRNVALNVEFQRVAFANDCDDGKKTYTCYTFMPDIIPGTRSEALARQNQFVIRIIKKPQFHLIPP